MGITRSGDGLRSLIGGDQLPATAVAEGSCGGADGVSRALASDPEAGGGLGGADRWGPGGDQQEADLLND